MHGCIPLHHLPCRRATQHAEFMPIHVNVNSYCMSIRNTLESMKRAKYPSNEHGMEAVFGCMQRRLHLNTSIACAFAQQFSSSPDRHRSFSPASHIFPAWQTLQPSNASGYYAISSTALPQADHSIVTSAQNISTQPQLPTR